MSNADTQTETWQQLDEIIGTWLEDRQELIVLYCSLCGVRALADSPEEVRVLERLKNFCQILVDYMSAGHFEIFAKILEEAEQSGNIDMLQKAYIPIEESTQVILDFNDVYDTDEHSKQSLSQLPDQLSNLGELLVARFDNEDVLINGHKTAQAA